LLLVLQHCMSGLLCECVRHACWTHAPGPAVLLVLQPWPLRMRPTCLCFWSQLVAVGLQLSGECVKQAALQVPCSRWQLMHQMSVGAACLRRQILYPVY
jgi:hypothetical protein